MNTGGKKKNARMFAFLAR